MRGPWRSRLPSFHFTTEGPKSRDFPFFPGIYQPNERTLSDSSFLRSVVVSFRSVSFKRWNVTRSRGTFLHVLVPHGPAKTTSHSYSNLILLRFWNKARDSWFIGRKSERNSGGIVFLSSLVSRFSSSHGTTIGIEFYKVRLARRSRR